MHLYGVQSLVLRRLVYCSGCGVMFSEFSAEAGEELSKDKVRVI